MTKKTKTKNTIKIILCLVLVLAIVGIGGGFLFYQQKLKPVSEVSEKVAFTVEKSMSGREVAAKLKKENLIQDETIARIWLKLHGNTGLYAGNFILDRNMSLPEIFAVLSNEKNAIIEQVKVTIPEGMWAKDAAVAIAEKTNLTAEELMAYWNDSKQVEKLIESYEFVTDDVLASEHCLLEGYIMPETYYFYPNTTVEQVTGKILDQLGTVYESHKDKIKASNYSFFELLTLASVVNFEANTAEDMKLVAGVFINRLAKGMRMGSSVTVCYALYDKFKTWQDCERNPDIDSRYNTYKYDGLPLGPICNPGVTAIEAVLDPTPSNYLYFMSEIDTGIMHYAETYQQHQQNVNKYLR